MQLGTGHRGHSLTGTLKNVINGHGHARTHTRTHPVCNALLSSKPLSAFCHKRWGAESRTGWLYNPCCIYTPPYWLLHFPPFFFFPPFFPFPFRHHFFSPVSYLDISDLICLRKPNPFSCIVFPQSSTIIPLGSFWLSSSPLFPSYSSVALTLVFHSISSLFLLLTLSCSRSFREAKRRELKCLTTFLSSCR